jgi:hypothetical protein
LDPIHQDYSVLVQDPDADAKDPDEWRSFFEQFGEIASITVALDNGPLLQALARRRLIKMMVEYESGDSEVTVNALKRLGHEKLSLADLMKKRAEPSVQTQKPKWMTAELNEVNAASVLNAAGFGLSPEQWLQQWDANQQRIKALYERTYNVTKVICVFESEQGQRNCLSKLQVGLVHGLLDWQSKDGAHLRFRGTNQLCVSEAPEPPDLIWENLGKNTWVERGVQRIMCLGYLGLLNTGFGVLIWFITSRASSTIATTLAISLIDEISPGE